MHGLYLTAITLLLLGAVVAYAILAEQKGVSKIRVIMSWTIVVLALILLVGINVTCPHERTQVRIVYIVLFLLLLYNALTDQFMGESLLNMSISLKSKLVGVIAVGLITYAIARTRVWMLCNVHLDAIRAVYDEQMGQAGQTGQAMIEMIEIAPPAVEISPVMSREQKVDLMEAVIKSGEFKPREIRRMMRTQRGVR